MGNSAGAPLDAVRNGVLRGWALHGRQEGLPFFLRGRGVRVVRGVTADAARVCGVATLVAWADGAPFRCAGLAVPPRRVPWFQCAACARLRAGFTLHSFIPWFVMDALVVGAALLAYSCQIVAVCAAAVQVNPKGTPCYVTVYQVCKGDADDADEFVGDGYVKPSMLLCVFFVPVAALTLTPIQIVIRVSEMRADM